FGNDEGSIWLGFDDRVTDVPHIGYRLPVDQAVASRALRTALHRVTCYRACRKLVPLIRAPAELVNHRPKRKTGISHATRDNNLGTSAKTSSDRAATEVNVGALNSIEHRLERIAGIQVLQLNSASHEIFEPLHYVVASDRADLDLASESFLLRDVD